MNNEEIAKGLRSTAELRSLSGPRSAFLRVAADSLQKVKCDMVKCVYNSGCRCNAKTVSITLTHDEISEKGYIECETMILED